MSETFNQTRWDLCDLLEAPSGAPLEKALAEIEQRTTAFENARAQLQPDISADTLNALIRAYEDLNIALTRIAYYGFLWFSEDTQSQAALSFKARMEQLLAEIANRTLFFTLWWKSLDDANIARLLTALQSGDDRYWLEKLYQLKPHTLTEVEEQVINLKDVNGISGLLTVYDIITNKYVFSLEVDGETRQLTQGELMNYVRHPSAEVRAAAYQELVRVYAKDDAVLSQIYANRVNDWRTEQMQLRHYSSPLAVRNVANDLPESAVETLLQVCRQNAVLFQRYFRLKAKWLGLNPMRRSDIYAPIAQADKHIPFNEAVALVLDSFEKFSPRVAQEARAIFTSNHIDSEIRPGKLSGAFCASTVPQLTPWVLVNYANKPRDVSTLAHELGHAVHSQLSRGHTQFTFYPSLPMAETASVFSEMILNERLLQAEKDIAVRREILARVIDDTYATVMRQAYFVMFEQAAHTAIAQNKTMDDLNALYLENLHEQFGDALEIADDFKWEWLVIPHIFHTPFYPYAYSFGQLLTLSLYQRYHEEGQSFVPKYLKILSYGGSASPAQILGEAGIDINAAQFWQGGFDVIKGFIEQLEAL